MPALADDSGLEVDALNGEPGIYSARYSSSGSDLDNCKKLLSKMRGVSKENRTARFKCCLLGFYEGSSIFAEGVLEGEIAEELKGDKGFGYDPFFVPSNFKQTFGEMVHKKKIRLDHRYIAFKKLAKLYLTDN